LEADELAAAHKRIAQLEAKLALTRDACELFNAEAVVPPKRRRAITEALIARNIQPDRLPYSGISKRFRMIAVRRSWQSPTRRSGDYGWGAGTKPDGVVAVTVGVATLVSGAVGGVVVVTVCPVPCGATGPATCSGSAELTLPEITPSTPMATAALTPIVANPTSTALPAL
jgi:hypothetical protein